MSQFINTRTFLVKAKDADREWKQRDVMLMVRDLGFKPYVRKATPRDQPGVFAVTLKEEYKEKKQEIIDGINEDDDAEFEYWPAGAEEEIQEIVITGYPEEINEKTIQEYMAIYVHNPKVKFLMMEDEDFGDVESGDASVIHTGLKQILPRYVKVAPGRTAFVKKASQVPWDDMILQCANCLGTGHLRFSCTLRKKCFKCQREGHVAGECKKCENCRRYGHETAECRKKMNRKYAEVAKPQEKSKTQNLTATQIERIDKSLEEMREQIVDNIAPSSPPSNQEQFNRENKQDKTDNGSNQNEVNMVNDGNNRKRAPEEAQDNGPESKRAQRRRRSKHSLSGEGSSANVPSRE